MKRYIIVLLLLMVVSFVVQKMIIVLALPNADFAILPTIPLFFILLGAVTIRIVYPKTNPSVIVLMGIKTMKILLSLTLILLYVFLNGKNISAFLVSFLVYFVLYLVFETWMLTSMNKKTNLNND